MKNPEKMLYQENTLASNFIMIFIILNLVFTIFTMNNMPVNSSVGTFTMLNILLSLLGFLASTKCKIYKKNWGYFALIIGVAQIFRFIVLPMEIAQGMRMFLIVTLEISAFAMIIGSIITINRATVRQRFIDAQAQQ